MMVAMESGLSKSAKGLVTNYGEGGGGGQVKFYPYEKAGRGGWKKF